MFVKPFALRDGIVESPRRLERLEKNTPLDPPSRGDTRKPLSERRGRERTAGFPAGAHGGPRQQAAELHMGSRMVCANVPASVGELFFGREGG